MQLRSKCFFPFIMDYHSTTLGSITDGRRTTRLFYFSGPYIDRINRQLMKQTDIRKSFLRSAEAREVTGYKYEVGYAPNGSEAPKTNLCLVPCGGHLFLSKVRGMWGW